MSGLLVVFTVSLLACAYPYLGYPAILRLRSWLRGRPVRKGSLQPAVTVIIPVHNEAKLIGDKVRNTLALRYPRDRLEVLVVSDGSSDETERIVRSFWTDRVRLISLPHSGKARALNVGASEATGEILAFTDADIELEPDSLARLVENFADPEVGGACGNKRYRPAVKGDATGTGEGLYWTFDKWQKRLESTSGSVFAADGALHAVRRDLYTSIRDASHADDIAISARVVLQGWRLIFEPCAVTWEDSPADARDEFRRKVRIANQSFRALLGLGRGLWSHGFYSVQLVSHKLLRYLVPFFLVPLFLSSLVLAAGGPFFQLVFGAQALVYGLAVAGFLLRRRRLGRWKPFAMPFFFGLVNAAALLGVLSVLKGRRQQTWATRSRVEVT